MLVTPQGHRRVTSSVTLVKRITSNDLNRQEGTTTHTRPHQSFLLQDHSPAETLVSETEQTQRPKPAKGNDHHTVFDIQLSRPMDTKPFTRTSMYYRVSRTTTLTNSLPLKQKKKYNNDDNQGTADR